MKRTQVLTISRAVHELSVLCSEFSCVLFFFFWVIPRRLNFMCRRFGLILFQAYGDGTECSATLAQNSDAGESLKRKNTTFRTRRKFQINKNSVVFPPSSLHFQLINFLCPLRMSNEFWIHRSSRFTLPMRNILLTKSWAPKLLFYYVTNEQTHISKMFGHISQFSGFGGASG
jgi:hypothetical protein